MPVIPITTAQLVSVMGCSQTNASNFIAHIHEAMERAEINTALRAAHFFAQIGHECGGLRYMEELADGAAYEGRRDLGNTQPGDGKKYKGHGLIQVTGKRNHLLYGHWLGLGDLFVEQPRLIVTDLRFAALTSAWFWASNRLNALADQDKGLPYAVKFNGKPITVNETLARITRVVNGGVNGIDDRQRRFDWAKRELGVP